MNKTHYLSKDNTKCIKGIFAVFILLHHLYQYSGIFHKTYLGIIFQAMGYLSVGMFFFFSGYGLMLSSQRKGYMDSFLSKRFLPLYGFYVVLIFMYTFYMVLLGGEFSLKSLIRSFLFGGTNVALGWYLQVTFLVYLLYWIIYKFIKRPNIQVIVFTVCLVIYCIICNKSGLATTWYESVFCVTLGMLFFLYREYIDNILQSKVFFIMLVSGVLFGICIVSSHIFEFGLLFKMASSLFFVITAVSLVFLLQNTSIICNRFTTVLGMFSLEIYVSQGFMLALRQGIKNTFLFLVIAILGTSLISIIMKQIYNGVTKFIIHKLSEKERLSVI